MEQQFSTQYPGSIRPKLLEQTPPNSHQEVWDKTKILIQIASTITCIILIALSGYIETTFSGIQWFPGGWAIGIPTGVLVLLWNVSAFVHVYLRKRISGFPPGYRVAGELIIWCGAVVALSFESILATDASGSGYRLSDPPPQSLYRAILASAAFLSLLIILHFTLFVRACIEVDRKNKAEQIQNLVMGLQQNGINLNGPFAPGNIQQTTAQHFGQGTYNGVPLHLQIPPQEMPSKPDALEMAVNSHPAEMYTDNTMMEYSELPGAYGEFLTQNEYMSQEPPTMPSEGYLQQVNLPRTEQYNKGAGI
ncbi:hypothetical protein GQ53DRAFT_817849 [Thozetella sp. PMI_491]|nr:hypothetical protein GQ53DRAFT_817849 [Thozetella sp. PMI_491]